MSDKDLVKPKHNYVDEMQQRRWRKMKQESISVETRETLTRLIQKTRIRDPIERELFRCIEDYWKYNPDNSTAQLLEDLRDHPWHDYLVKLASEPL